MIANYKMAISKYKDFRSKSTREEFWWFLLGNTLIFFGIFLFTALLSLFGFSFLEKAFDIIIILFVLATFIPSLAISVRRLHDTGRTGRIVLMFFIFPAIGAIFLFIFCAQKSQKKDNKWGPFLKAQEQDLTDVLIDFDKDS